MEKEILEEYEKIKDKLSKEEFLAEMEEIRKTSYENLPFIDEIDLARDVVKNYIGNAENLLDEETLLGDISSDNTDNVEVNITDSVLEKFDKIKDYISKEDFINRIKELKIENADVSFMDEETFADQIVGEFITEENPFISDKKEHSTDNIASLEPGDNDKSIIGKVMLISNVKSFTTSKGKHGKVCNVELEDNSGKIRLVLWTENIKHLKNISEGDIVQVHDVDIKDGYSGLEATMRPRSSIEKVNDFNPSDFPAYNENITNIEDIEADSTVNIIARITKIPTVRTYNKNGKEGKVQSIELQDATGNISYTLWNKNVELIDDLKLHDGDTVKILQAQVRERNGELSLSHWDGRIIKGDYDVPEFSQDISKIEDLDDGDRDIAIIGVVSKVQDIKKFIRKTDNSEGQLRNFELMDDTGSMRITLWGDDADLEINKRDVVKLIGGNVVYDEYTDNGHSINTNFNTQISINPDNLSDDQKELFDSIKESLQPMTLEQIKASDDEGEEVEVIGRIMSIGDVRTFLRQSDDSEGRVRSSVFSDGSEIVQVVFWDDKTEIDIKPGEAYHIENARTRWGYEDLELNVGNSSRVIKLSDENAKFLPSFETLENMIYEYREIDDLDEDDKNIYVVGRIFEVYDVREIERDDGSKNLLRNIEIADNSRAIRVSLWGDDTKREFEVGEPLKIQNPRISYYNEDLTLSVSGGTAILKPSDEELLKLPSYDELKEAIYKPKNIEAIEDYDVNVRVTGKLTDLRDDKILIRKCPNCGNNIPDEVVEDEPICDYCGAVIEEPRTIIMLPARIEDDTGTISITFFDTLVEELVEMPKDEIVNLILDDSGALEGRIDDLEDLTVEVIANVSFDEYNEEKRLNPKKILQKYY